jgi:indole-3-glycerol phosphate synthase
MLQTVPDILSRIVDRKKAELRESGGVTAELERRAAAAASARRTFRGALSARTPAIIAEIKKASPSKGLLSASFDPPAIARKYAGGGASALSVLTDRDFFQGSLADLRAARQAVTLPALRKDFTLDEFHVVEAAAAGADAILLIAAILESGEMRRFRELAASFQMDSLVEVHKEDELARALDSGAEIIGVNNRDLHTFEVSLDTSVKLAEKIPAGLLRVSESGIRSRADVDRLAAAGYSAFLVGEHLMGSADPEAALKRLL